VLLGLLTLLVAVVLNVLKYVILNLQLIIFVKFALIEPVCILLNSFLKSTKSNTKSADGGCSRTLTIIICIVVLVY